jgi:hypothetical protein
MIKLHVTYPRLRRAEGAAALIQQDLDALRDTLATDVSRTVRERGTVPATDYIRTQQRVTQAIAALADARALLLDAARIVIHKPSDDGDV